MELAGAALRVQQTLETRAHAFAMISACHLHSWVVRAKKFMALYARKPSDMFGAPDRLVPAEVFQLCFSTNIVVDRDMLHHVLIERPKVLKAEREKAQVPPPPTPSGLPPLPCRSEGKR